MATIRTMIKRLSGEILDAIKSTGGAVKKREDTHKMAEVLYRTGHYIQYTEISHNGKEYEKVYVYICIVVSLFSTPDANTIL